MPLIVKLKRPGGSPATAPAADVETAGALTSVFDPPASLATPSLAAASPAAVGHDEDEMVMGDEAGDGGNRTPTDQDLHIKLEPQEPPQTPEFNKVIYNNDNIKSPIDTAMQDSTPIMEQATQSLFSAAAASATAQTLPAVTPPAAAVDVIIAPACLQHRYVRSYDISTIVERPERLRAVILGISAAIGRAHTATSLNNNLFVQQPRSGTVDALQTDGTAPGGNHDDLANRLQGMSLSRALASSNPVNIWLSTRSLDLHPPHPAVSYVHAHPEEGVPPISPEFAASRDVPFSTDVLQQCGQTVKIEVLTKQEASSLDAPATEINGVTFASYLAELCRLAPSGPPERVTDDPDRTLPGPHPSEVPTEYSQGDLYLRGHHGPESGGGGEAGGSGEAIRHALGACAEAVDSVVAAVNSPLYQQLKSKPQNLAHLHLPLDPFLALPDAHTPVPGPSRRNFVLTRPPGHHCSGNQPSGFCWTSNAVVAAAHAYIEHGIDRVIILDVDLHHGNGTQSLAWRINQETLTSDTQRDARIAAYQQALTSSHSPKPNRTSHHHAGHRKSPSKSSGPTHDDAAPSESSSLQAAHQPSAVTSAGAPPPAPLLPPDLAPRGLKIFYGSLHDIESYPCETGDPELVRDASTCIEGSHGQWIWNVHLDSYANEAEFEELYTAKYSSLFTKARRFARSTSADPARTLVLISAGFDACAHEYSTMSRHGRSVPVSFYSRFANDTVALAEEVAGGKVVSILEGGYSDRALSSAAMALVSGLAGYVPSPSVAGGAGQRGGGGGGGCEEWWELESLLKLEKAAKKAAENGLVGQGGSATGPNSANTTPNSSVLMSATPSGGGGRRRAAAPSASNPAWLQSAMSVYATLERAARIRPDGSFDTFDSNPANCGGGNGGMATGSGRVLRDRTKGRAVSGAVGSAALTSTPTHGGVYATSTAPSSATGTPIAPTKVKMEPT